MDRKYVSIQCTGYLKSWPCTKVGLGSDFSDQESVDESSMSCLVAVARLQPSFSASIEDCVERGISFIVFCLLPFLNPYVKAKGRRMVLSSPADTALMGNSPTWTSA